MGACWRLRLTRWLVAERDEPDRACVSSRREEALPPEEVSAETMRTPLRAVVEALSNDRLRSVRDAGALLASVRRSPSIEVSSPDS